MFWLAGLILGAATFLFLLLYKRKRRKYSRLVCEGCGCEYDPDVCWCGEFIKEHTAHLDPPHPAIGLGCRCLIQ